MSSYADAFRYRLHADMDYVFDAGVVIDTTLTDPTTQHLVRWVVHPVAAAVPNADDALGRTRLCNLMLQLCHHTETTLHYDNICPTTAVQLICAHARAVLTTNQHQQD